MDTQAIVTMIKEDHAPDWSREKILVAIDRAQKKLFAIDCGLTTFLNYSDPSFPLPILNTVAGTLKYDIIDTNLLDSAGAAVSMLRGGYPVRCRRVKNVFIKSSAIGSYDDRYFRGEQFDWAGVNTYWTKQLFNMIFTQVPIMQPQPRSGLENASVQFCEDPGTHTDRYYVEFYYTPVDLTDESVPLSIDGDIWDDAIIDYAVGQIELAQYGRSERVQKFEQYWKKKFRSYGSAGADQRRPMQMAIRECG